MLSRPRHTILIVQITMASGVMSSQKIKKDCKPARLSKHQWWIKHLRGRDFLWEGFHHCKHSHVHGSSSSTKGPLGVSIPITHLDLQWPVCILLMGYASQLELLTQYPRIQGNIMLSQLMASFGCSNLETLESMLARHKQASRQARSPEAVILSTLVPCRYLAVLIDCYKAAIAILDSVLKPSARRERHFVGGRAIHSSTGLAIHIASISWDRTVLAGVGIVWWGTKRTACTLGTWEGELPEWLSGMRSYSQISQASCWQLDCRDELRCAYSCIQLSEDPKSPKASLQSWRLQGLYRYYEFM